MNWISVKDNPPEEDKMVLTLNPDQPIMIFVVASRFEETEMFIDYDEYPFYPTHWMPIPEAPKE